jgi:hypothetical protein
MDTIPEEFKNSPCGITMIMRESHAFYPPKNIGTYVHLLLIALFSAGGVWGIVGVTQARVALELLPYLGLIGVFLITVPFLIYRLYSLQRSEYLLERGGIKLSWGWRSEDIPMEQVHWVYRVEDLEIPPQPPLLRWPGSVIGRKRFQRGPIVEYLASQVRGMVIIAAGEGYFGITPERADEFLSTYQLLIELGSLDQLKPQSVRPSLIVTEVTGRRPLLILILAGALLNISLLIWTLLVIPARDQISLGFTSAGRPREALESVRLILFPIINTTGFLANLLLGLFLFRNPEKRGFAYILWGGSILTALLFHLAMIFILS